MVTLYTTHCPKCKILEQKLNDKNISFTEVTDIKIMISMNMLSVPYLEVDGTIMNFGEAVKWINEYCN